MGLDESTARQTLESNDLHVSVNYVTSASNVAYGNVISQSYNSGTSVQSGSSITITVSHYEQPATTQAATTAPATTTAPVQATTAAAATTTAAAAAGNAVPSN